MRDGSLAVGLESGEIDPPDATAEIETAVSKPGCASAFSRPVTDHRLRDLADQHKRV